MMYLDWLLVGSCIAGALLILVRALRRMLKQPGTSCSCGQAAVGKNGMSSTPSCATSCAACPYASRNLVCSSCGTRPIVKDGQVQAGQHSDDSVAAANSQG